MKNLIKGAIMASALLFFGHLSAQSGISWNPTIDVSSNTAYGNQHPRMVLDRSGDPMIVWGNAGSNNANFSRWNGGTFTNPWSINDTIPVFAASWAGPDIAANGDTVYIVVKETPEVTSYIYLLTSYDGGASFQPPVRVDVNLADSVSRFPTVTTNSSGNPVIGYMKFNPDFSTARWVVASSSDYGATIGTDILASGWSGGDVCDCCPGTMVSSGSTIAMLYRDNNSNIRDNFAGISNDNGSTFTSGYNLDNLNWFLVACPSSGPDGIIEGGNLHAVTMNGSSGNNLVYYSRSTIASATTDTVYPVTGAIAGLSAQNYPRIATDGVAAGIVWTQTLSGQQQLPILFTNNILNGFPVQYDTVDLGNIANVDIAINDGTIHVVWEDPSTNTVKYRSGMYNSILDIEDVPYKNNMSIYPNPVGNIFTITIASEIDTKGQLKYYDMAGKLVKTQSIVLQNGKVNADATGLTEGLYILNMVIDGKQYNTRLIKQ